MEKGKGEREREKGKYTQQNTDGYVRSNIQVTRVALFSCHTAIKLREKKKKEGRERELYS